MAVFDSLDHRVDLSEALASRAYPAAGKRQSPGKAGRGANGRMKLEREPVAEEDAAMRHIDSNPHIICTLRASGPSM